MGNIAVEVSGVWHSFGDNPVLCGVDLRVEEGEFVTLLGPSGSGKTTLLRILGGLVTADRGTVTIDGTDVTRIPAQARGIGFVFQNYALFPHMTVWDNVAFPLKVRKVAQQARDEKIAHALDLVELGELRDRMPGQLSGGQQQRVALARALVFDPRVVLMDEPLGSLDKRLREQLQDSIRIVQRRVGFTAVYVTHDQSEAFSMSDRIAVMHEGEILQIGRPDEIYRRPTGTFVARFVGDLNRFHGKRVNADGSDMLACDGGVLLPLPPRAAPEAAVGEDLTLGVRPEAMRLSAAPTDDCPLPGVIRLCSFQGSHFRVLVELDLGVLVEVEHRGAVQPGAEGDPAWIGWAPSDALVFVGAGE